MLNPIKLFLLFIFTLNSNLVLAEPLEIYGLNSQGKANVYLGCLNCSPQKANSIWNDRGKYGFYNYLGKASIWNRMSAYGSVSSPRSAFASGCNPQAPVVIGRYTKLNYGRFCVKGIPVGNNSQAYRKVLTFLRENEHKIRGKSFSQLPANLQSFIKKFSE
ncbi:hypothetical protein [Psittacicella gerlachiana]|uniref:Uncharacterized protein n=1 Tax=Psittacicella gerlachiana TaxID=2028574 RepID=A0A3A1Y8T7_9GAMM|nr:hypothetical protein [Psittacicella gerlachiana]RIY34723.1 hypothetical protein CKF59_04980 [Psittacicella gerlachiana]